MESAAARNVTETLKLEVEPSRELKVVAAIAIFVDPVKFPTPKFLDALPSNMMATVGIHPKAASQSSGFLRHAVENLGQLLEHPRVIGIGKIGHKKTKTRRH